MKKEDLIIYKMDWAYGQYVAVSDENKVYTSKDAINWTEVENPNTKFDCQYEIEWKSKYKLFKRTCQLTGTKEYSKDGIEWNERRRKK